MHHFGRYNVDELPVFESRRSRRLVGSVHRQQVIEAYNRELFRRDLAGSFHGVVTAVDKTREVELGNGFRLV